VANHGQTGDLPSQRSRTVLIVDDSATLRRAIAIELAPLNFRVVEAADGAQGIAKAREVTPDLITLDIKMPGLSGYDVCEELKLYDETIGIPIIMISSSPSDQERLESLATGAVEYFVKPFAKGALAEFVVDLLSRLEQNRDKSVYCIDENRGIRAMLGRLLSNHGYRSRVFSDSAELQEALRSEPCDLLVLDLNMKDRAGIDLLHTVRRQPTLDLVPILALTASGARKDLPIAFRGGANEFLRKPFFVEELLARVENQLVLRTLKQRLQLEATIDPLTKLVNRRELIRLLRTEVHRALREHEPLGVLVIDIDHFKKINDTHGHSVGDEVLAGVARRLTQTVRATDIVGRLGGEEFVVLAPKATQEGLTVLAERLRRVIEGEPVPSAEGPLRVTVSVGGASWPDGSLKLDLALDGAIHHADQALYLSKSNGRNRSTVVVVPTPG
jgi:two-component system, cell cycle response regulator